MTIPRPSRMNRLACSALEGTIAGIARSLSSPAAERGHDSMVGHSDRPLERCGAAADAEGARCGSLDAARCGSREARCGSHEQRCGALLGREAWQTAEQQLVRVC